MRKLDRLVFINLNRCENNESLKTRYINMRQTGADFDKQLCMFRNEVDDFMRDLLLESCCDKLEQVWKLYKQLLVQAMEEVQKIQKFPEIEMENLIEALYPENVMSWLTECIHKNQQLERTIQYLDNSLYEFQVEQSFWEELKAELTKHKTKERETVRHQKQFLRIMGDLYWTLDEVNRIPLN